MLRKSIHQTQYFLLRLVGVSGTNKILGESMTREKLIEKWQELDLNIMGSSYMEALFNEMELQE